VALKSKSIDLAVLVYEDILQFFLAVWAEDLGAVYCGKFCDNEHILALLTSIISPRVLGLSQIITNLA
jgi:hypothetical protein